MRYRGYNIFITSCLNKHIVWNLILSSTREYKCILFRLDFYKEYVHITPYIDGVWDTKWFNINFVTSQLPLKKKIEKWVKGLNLKGRN